MYEQRVGPHVAPQTYFTDLSGAVIVFSFSMALALRKANFVGRNIGH